MNKNAQRSERRYTHRVDTETAPGWALLLAQILRRVPRLDGALCTRHVPLHDAAGAAKHDDRVQAAKAICARCPALVECRAHYLSTPEFRRPHGVIGGIFRADRIPTSEAMTSRPSSTQIGEKR